MKDASVARLWPNRVVVRVAERTPVAFVTLAASRFALIDEDGVILPPAPDRFHAAGAGRRARRPIRSAERRERVQRMLRLTRDLGERRPKISRDRRFRSATISRSPQPYEGRVVTLLLGDHNFALRYQNFVRNYREIKRQLPGATTLDLRLEDRITVVE